MMTTTDLSQDDIVRALTTYAQCVGLLPIWEDTKIVNVQFEINEGQQVRCRLTVRDKDENPATPQQQGAAADQERVIEPQAETVR